MPDEPVQAGAAASPAAPSGAGPGGAAPAVPWYQGISDDVRGWAESKKWLDDDPKAAFAKAVTAHREAQKYIGAPHEEILRMPKPNADTAEINSFWNRLGVPVEPKDYDFSEAKFADGTELDPSFADSLRSAMHNARVPKERAGEILKTLIKMEEADEAGALADRTASMQRQQEELRTNWGNNYDVNMLTAKNALERIGQAAGLDANQVKEGWDALSTLGGIGAAYAMEMLRVAGSRMGEAPFITGGNRAAEPEVMSAAQAAAEIDALKVDKAFGQRLLAGDREARRKWDNLHAIWSASRKSAA